jgi:ATP-dependent protease ClpP protease subunit
MRHFIKPDITTICVDMAASGQPSDIGIHANHILKTRKTLNQIISVTTTQPLEKVERDTDRDYSSPLRCTSLWFFR